MSAQMLKSIRCANCKARTTGAAQQIIDAHDLAVKSAFLQGQMRDIKCDKCGSIILSAIPTLYYDQDKQFAFIFVPNDIHLAKTTQEKTISALVDRLANSLPAEQRTAYLLAPQRFSSLKSMVDAILQADGITDAVLQAQTAKAKLIETLLQSASEAELKQKATDHAAELDATFFELLTAYMQAAQMKGDQAGAQIFLAIRALLGQWSEQSRALIAEIDAQLGLTVIQSRAELLERLQSAADDTARATLVATGHVLLDDTFFQLLNAATNDAANASDMVRVTALTDLKAAITALQASHAASSQAAMQRAATLFKAVVQSDTPDQVLKRNVQAIDEAFFIVLGANIERARRQDQAEPARALELIGQLARSVLQERAVGN